MKIKRLQIKNLGHSTDVDWKMNPRVNILVGPNGSGKSAILKIIADALEGNLVYNTFKRDEVIIEGFNKEIYKFPPYAHKYIGHVRHLEYPYGGGYYGREVNLAKLKRRMQNLFDFYFPEPQQGLSNGERNLISLLYEADVAFRFSKEPNVFIVDNPEAGLHLEWQEKLLGWLLKLNPKGQLIVTTHSPAICYGWEEYVVSIEEICKERKHNENAY